MKIFISWSGEHSLGVATALRDWLPYVFPSIRLFLSSEDIRKGKRWMTEIGQELEKSNFGIVCLTPANLLEPWILFEAGALSKLVNDSNVFTLLTGGLRPASIHGPLSHFQHTVFEREDFYKLIKSINVAYGVEKQEEARLAVVFDKFWCDLDNSVSSALNKQKSTVVQRTTDDKLDEILETVTQIAKALPSSSLWKSSPIMDLFSSGTITAEQLAPYLPAGASKPESRPLKSPLAQLLSDSGSAHPVGMNGPKGP